MRTIFEQIYAQNAWRFGSGEGSRPAHTRGYVDFLQGFLAERGVRSVVDVGFGDWQFSRRVDWRGIRYVGIDVVAPLVERARAKFGAPNVSFRLADARDPLPDADLLIVKDVLQHWSNAEIQAFLPRLAAYRYALVTNCVDPRGPAANRDVATGGFRCLDIRSAPFGVRASEAYAFENRRPLPALLRPRWRKKVLLVEHGGRR
jgi:SAM-dependent methyltransferase